jgi:regulator of sigma E protease
MENIRRIELGMAAAVLLAALLSSAVFGIIATIIVVALLILLHEFGHWIVARIQGIDVPVFSVGFGREDQSIAIGRFWGTEFQLRRLLLGGFVKPDPKSYQQASFKARAAVLAAGPLMNLLIPLILFFTLFAVSGLPVPGEIKNSYIAGLSETIKIGRDAGLREGDIVASVDGVPIQRPEQFIQVLQERKNNSIVIDLKRGDDVVTVLVVPDANGKIGVQVGAHIDMMVKHVNIAEAVGLAFSHTGAMLWELLGGYGRLFQGQDVDQLQSIVGIVASGSDAVNTGIANGIYFASMLSIALAVLNLLPLPVLDGGQLVLLAVEKVRGKALAPVTQTYMNGTVIALFAALFCYALYNDLVRILGALWATPAMVIVVCATAAMFLPKRR